MSVDKEKIRQQVLRDIFVLAASHRRKWRKEAIDPKDLGQLLTLIRKITYKSIRLDKENA